MILSPLSSRFAHRQAARWLPVLIGLAGCNLQKQIDVPTPAYDPKLVVECYLEPGQPIRMLVQRTQPFAAPPPVSFNGGQFQVDPTFLSFDATAVVSGPRGAITLTFSPSVDTVSGIQPHFFTHSSALLFDGQPGETFSLEVTDTEGHRLTGTTTVLQPVPIDTVEVSYNPDKPYNEAKAALLTRFRDPATPGDAYRYQTNKLDRRGRRERVQGFEFPDDRFNGDRSAAGSSYRFSQGDTLEVELYRISRAYHDFLQSVDDAQGANGNPFAQPASIKSTVSGGLGVFTTLAADRRQIILKR